MKNVLFVCSQNRLRSPTAERVFADWPGVTTASVGTNHDAEVPLLAELRDRRVVRLTSRMISNSWMKASFGL